MLDADTLASLAGPMGITLAYVCLYYGFMLNIMQTKIRLKREYSDRGEKFDRYFGEDREMLAADRLQLNLLEHMPPFLVLLWLVAVFVGPWWATAGGAVYLLSRLIYPFVLGRRLGRGVKGAILLATVPGYLVMAYFVVVLAIVLTASLVG